MPVVSIKDVGKHDGQEVTLQGWLYNLREAGKLLFPIFRDGTGTIQGVVSLKDQPAAFEKLRGLTQESSVIVTGRIHADKRAPGGYEIQITAIEVVQRVRTGRLPDQLKEHSVDFLLDTAICGSARRARLPYCASVLRPCAPRTNIWTRKATSSPKLPSSLPASVSAATTLFEVQYIDDEKAYLRSPASFMSKRQPARQGLHSSPTFRAEKSRRAATSRNSGLLEPEAAYAHLEDMMALGEGLVSHVVQSVLKKIVRELETLGRDTSKLANVTAPSRALPTTKP